MSIHIKEVPNSALELVNQESAVTLSQDRFKRNREREWGLYGHDMGLHQFNLMFGGWVPTKVTTIAGRSGHGKSAITIPMIEAAGRVLGNRRAELCIFTWESEASHFVDRYISSKTGYTSRWLTQGAKLLKREELEKVELAYKEAKKLPVVYQQHSTNIKVVDKVFKKFCEDCKIKEQKEGIEIVPVGIVDYIGMAEIEGNGLRTYGIGEFMSGLKRLCNETGGCFAPIAQIGRAADGQDLPDRKDLSDSQFIENNSDNLVIIHRPEYLGQLYVRDPDKKIDIPAEKKMIIRAMKGRDFGIGDKLIGCDIAKYKFWDLDLDQDFKYWTLYNDPNFWMSHFGLNKK